MIDLTARQREDLTEQFAELVVDQMDLKALMIYAQEQLIDYYNNCSLEELKEEVNNYDEELYDELVDNVTQQYPKQNPTFHMDQAFNKAYKEV